MNHSLSVSLSFEPLVLHMSCTLCCHLVPLSYTGSYVMLGKRLGKDRQFQIGSGAGTPGGTSRAGPSTIKAENL